MTTPPLQVFEFDVVTVDARGRKASRRRSQARYFTEDLGSGVTLEAISIPGGEFVMGSTNEEAGAYERPHHKVTLEPFFMGKYQVTQAQWRAVAALPKSNRHLDTDPSWFKDPPSSRGSRPVEQVSWYDAVEFCERLSRKTGREYRLPSEAEWEYACQAGTNAPFHCGETITTDLANYNGDHYGSGPEGEYRQETTTVGSFPPNVFGLCDMHGNVWEWCADFWHQEYTDAPTDGSVWLEGGDRLHRPGRGGSWLNDPRYCRSACRRPNEADSRYNCLGFRVVCVF